jgi:tetratricopeptide repeat protein
MRLWATRAFVSHLAAAIILTTAGAAAAQGSLAVARDLYTAAAYDDALAMLNGLHVSDHRSDDSRAIDQYRALCLLALGRTAEATSAIQAIVTELPSYHLAEADVSPRVRAAFRDVRRLMLPGIIQQKYADAKVAFDRKNLAAASEGFKLVLELLGDSDLGSAANQPPLSQLRPLATGFRELTAAAATPSVAPSLPLLPARRSVPPPVAAAPTPSPRPAAPRIYGWEDANVVGPIVLRQTMPVLGDVFAQRQGTVEVIINEAGLVETAMMTSPVNAVYDGLVLAAARSWRYKPATIDGVAVKFRHAIQLDLKRR